MRPCEEESYENTEANNHNIGVAGYNIRVPYIVAYVTYPGTHIETLVKNPGVFCYLHSVKVDHNLDLEIVNIPVPKIPPTGAQVLPCYYKVAMFRGIIRLFAPDTYTFYRTENGSDQSAFLKAEKAGALVGYYDLSTDTPMEFAPHITKIDD